jgi:signal transduction histidine kinase
MDQISVARYRPHMHTRELVRRHGDWILAVGIIGLAEVQAWTAGNLDFTQKTLAGVSGLVFLPLLALRRRWPLVLLGALVAATVANFWLPDAGQGEAFGILTLVGVYSAAAHTGGRAAVAAGLLSGALWILITAGDPDGISFGALVFFGILVGGPFLFGRLIRARRLRETLLEERSVVLEREREERARAAVAEERTRIARELHDVVAHAISVIVLQARGGRRLLSQDPDETRRALDTIERTGSQALGEMRRLLGMLRADDEQLALAPQPSLSALDVLAREVTRAGLPVEVLIEGEPAELPAGVDLSAFRIVQEALTNALKHAGPARARVLVRYGDGELEIEVVDDGSAVGNGEGTGHGLLGIRERVTVYGGTFEAGRRTVGGYAVRARLPYAAQG